MMGRWISHMVVCPCDPRTQAIEAASRIQGRFLLHGKFEVSLGSMRSCLKIGVGREAWPIIPTVTQQCNKRGKDRTHGEWT